MATLDSDIRYHPPQELLSPIKGDFLGKDILGSSQFDQNSWGRLQLLSAKMDEDFRAQRTPPLLRGMVIVSAYDQRRIDRLTISRRFPFEIAIQRLGGNPPLHQELPAVDDPEFDYKLMDIKASLPDAVLITHPNDELVFRAAEVFRKIQGVVPIINTRVFENSRVSLPEALLALVLGKIK